MAVFRDKSGLLTAPVTAKSAVSIGGIVNDTSDTLVWRVPAVLPALPSVLAEEYKAPSVHRHTRQTRRAEVAILESIKAKLSRG